MPIEETLMNAMMTLCGRMSDTIKWGRAIFICLVTLALCTPLLLGSDSFAGVTSCQDLPVRISGPTPRYFATLQEAYNAATNGNSIQALAVTLTENPTLNNNITVTFDGGYNCGFASYGGSTALMGMMTQNAGTAVIGNFSIVSASPDSTYAISSSTNAGGAISPAGTMSVAQGASQAYTITPGTGYTIAQVLVDTVSVGTVTTYSFNSVAASHAIAVSFADITPPTCSIVINSGATYTNNANVNLALTASDTGSGMAQMQFSNDNAVWSTAEPYTTAKNWALSTGDGTKVVYVKFKDVDGNWSTPCSDSILLDATAPIVTISSPISGATNTNTPLLTYTVSDGTALV
jgi:hypothetical protein